MPLSTDVNLPRDAEPLWPDRCVCCGRPAPGATARLWTLSIGWWSLLPWHFGTLYSVRIPACPACGKRLRMMRLVKWIFSWAIAFAGVLIGMWLIGSYRGPMRKWLVILITLICMSPFFLWEIFFPPAFDITCFSKTADFEFRDPDYADEFESLNRFRSV
jgi:hypothetical protein